MQVEWTVDGGSVTIDPENYKGMSPTEISGAILDLCADSARQSVVYAIGLDATVRMIVESLTEPF